MTTSQSSKKAFVVKLAVTVIFCAPVGLIWIALSKRLTRMQKIAAGTFALFWFMLGFIPFLAGSISGTQLNDESRKNANAENSPSNQRSETNSSAGVKKSFPVGSMVVVRAGGHYLQRRRPT
jgi:hypothetical protein